MSNIYIQEPPTSGKVLLKTTVGDLELELWTKEAPKACRNFIQLCMEGYYNETIFHRVVKGFICQGGDPTGTGEGGESIYGQPFKDEIHTRLRFCRRGLLAMANAGKNDNGSQFFFTFSATPELQNKHTIFGKVTGETIYNMLKLEDAIVDANDRPNYPQKIIKCEILLNPFNDIIPRCNESSKNNIKHHHNDDDNDKNKKNKKVGVKNFKLLSFGEEAEEDEEESVVLNKKFIGKGKSAHDNLSDPKLSSVTAIDISGMSCQKIKRDERVEQDIDSDDDNNDNVDNKEERMKCVKKASKEMKERIINKLQDKKNKSNSMIITNDDKKINKKTHVDTDKEKNKKKKQEEEEEEEYYFGKDRDDEKRKNFQAIQKEIREFKKTLKNEKIAKEEIERKKIQDIEKNKKKCDIKNKFIKSKEEFIEAKLQIPKKGPSREKATQELLMKFRNKLKSVKKQNIDTNDDDDDKNNKNNKNNDDDDDDDDSWMKSILKSEEKNKPVLAKDASTKNDDWFEIYDPRNPINKRRRGDNSNSSSSSSNKTKKLNTSRH